MKTADEVAFEIQFRHIFDRGYDHLKNKYGDEFTTDREKAFDNFKHALKTLSYAESMDDPKAVNMEGSTGRGLYQFLEGPAFDAAETTERFLPQASWIQELKQHRDASRLSPNQQHLLMAAEMFGEKYSDGYTPGILNRQFNSLTDYWAHLHHTNPEARDNKNWFEKASQFYPEQTVTAPSPYPERIKNLEVNKIKYPSNPPSILTGKTKVKRAR